MTGFIEAHIGTNFKLYNSLHRGFADGSFWYDIQPLQSRLYSDDRHVPLFWA